MPGTDHAIRLTMAQALIRHLTAQYIEIDGTRTRLCDGGFGTFGHGNVTCLGEALYAHREELPLWRGQNEQSMAMAAIAHAKQQLRRRFMFATSSAGPDTTNMLTSAGIAHTTRPARLPDPIISVNDAFKSVTRYWDRISHPAQLIQSLPRAIETLLDPADCGPAFLGCRRTSRAGPSTIRWSSSRSAPTASAGKRPMPPRLRKQPPCCNPPNGR